MVHGQVASLIGVCCRSSAEDRSSREAAESAAAAETVAPRPLRQSVGRSEFIELFLNTRLQCRRALRVLYASTALYHSDAITSH